MGIIKIKAPSVWDTVPAGLLAAGDVLANNRINEYFTSANLDSVNFGTVKSGNGVAQQDTGFYVRTPAASDTAIGYVKQSIDKTLSNKYTFRQRINTPGNTCYLISIQQSAGAPVTGNSATISSKRIIELSITAIAQFRFAYWDSGGTQYFWNGSAWTTSSASFSSYSVLDLYESVLECDVVKWRLVIKNITTGVTIQTSDYVNWSDTRSTGVDPIWFTFGDPFNNVAATEVVAALFKEQYKTSPLVAQMGAIVNGVEITALPITESVESGATITWRYDIGAGWVTAGAGTLAELSAALIGTSPATLDLEATFTSDGDAGASFDINGGAIAGTGTCDYPLVDTVLEGVVYADGALIGTLKKYGVETDPGEPLRQQLITVLDTRLRTILISNGYKTDLGNNIFEWRDTEADPLDPDDELPGLNYMDEDAEPIQESHGPVSVENQLTVTMALYALTKDALRLARADVQIALGADPGFSTLAQDVSMDLNSSDVAHDDEKIWSTLMTIEFIYTTGRFDPYGKTD